MQKGKLAVALIGFITLILLGLYILNQDFLGIEKGYFPKTVKPSPTPLTIERFILMGDVGTAAPQQFAVADSIKDFCDMQGECKGVFILGDIIYEEGIVSASDPQLTTKLIEPYKNINLPFYLALGNHDYLGCEECFLEFSKNNPKWQFPQRYYQQDFKNTAFFVIDTENFDEEQRVWLRNSLAASAKKWKVVVGHRPIISEEITKKGENWSGKDELSEIVCLTADFYISGHAHILEDQGQLSECKTKLLISGSGGSYVREISENFSGDFYAAENGFLTLTLNELEATYSFYNQDGNVLK